MKKVWRLIALALLALVMSGKLAIADRRVQGALGGVLAVWVAVELADLRRKPAPPPVKEPEKEYYSPEYENPAMQVAIGTVVMAPRPPEPAPAPPPAAPIDEGEELERAVARLDADEPAEAIAGLEGLLRRAYKLELVTYYLAIAYGAARQGEQLRALIQQVKTDGMPVQRRYKLACMLEEARLYDLALPLYRDMQNERRRYPDLAERLARVRDIMFDGGPAAFDRQLIGMLDARYTDAKVLASGGMGVVFTAWDGQLARKVAIKMLSPLLRSDEQAHKRFLREGQVLQEMSHANLVKTFAVHPEPCPHYSMEFLEGKTLAKVISTAAPLPLPAVRHLSLQMLAALDYCHQRKIIHRDIKPANVLVPDASPLKIIDFGLVRSAMSSSITVEGTVMGTPPYMPPEQLIGEEVDETADLYSFGVVLYEMATGKLPFPPGDTMTQMIATGKYAPASTLRPDLPPGLDQVIGRLLHKDRKQRPVRAANVAEALMKVLPRADS